MPPLWHWSMETLDNHWLYHTPYSMKLQCIMDKMTNDMVQKITIKPGLETLPVSYAF